MAVAADVLRVAAPGQEVPESVREDGDPPRAVRLTEDLAGLPDLVAEESGAIVEGRVAVITSQASLTDVARALPGAGRPQRRRDEEAAPVVVLSVTESKGLEFDSVIVVRPEEVLDGPRGANDLYVALTRATRRLTVAHDREPPDLLARLRD